MRRRSFLYGSLGAVAACQPAVDEGLPRSASETHSWRMVTSWPPNFPGFGASANRLAERIGELSDGRIDIEVFAAGELIPAFEVFDTVARGNMQMGHSSPTYWRGTLPAAPVNDRVWGLHEVARYYYYPGWHEPSGVLEALIAADAYASLSPHLQAVIAAACRAEDDYVVAEFAARNQEALRTLVDDDGVELCRFPDDVLTTLRRLSVEVMGELASTDKDLGRVYASYRRYADAIGAWHALAEGSHTGIRGN